jgi:hypothetical protein
MDRGRLRGLLGFRLELQPDIRVIVIEPSAVATELTTHITHPDSKRAAHETTADTLIAPKDIAEVIAFAVSRPLHVALNEIPCAPPRKRSDSTARGVTRAAQSLLRLNAAQMLRRTLTCADVKRTTTSAPTCALRGHLRATTARRLQIEERHCAQRLRSRGRCALSSLGG